MPNIPDEGNANTIRPGRLCTDAAGVQALRLLQGPIFAKGKKIVVAQATASGHVYVPEGELRQPELYLHPDYIWLTLGSDYRWHRDGVDISLPAGPSLHCSGAKAMAALAEPSDVKQFFMTFKGKLRSRPTRLQLAHMHNDGHSNIIIDSWDGRWAFDELLFSSLFSLIPAGDTEWTPRFTEAVCSGGVPVLITHPNYVPPFEDLVPFSSYGVFVPSDEVFELAHRLRSELPRVEELRREARRVCELHFQTIEAQVASLAWMLPLDIRRARLGSPSFWAAGAGMKQPLRLADSKSVCLRLAYPLSFKEAEHIHPELESCLVSTFASDLHSSLSRGRCVAPSLADAQVVIVPGYAALSCNVLPQGAWPRVPMACRRDIARPGRWCAGNITFSFYQRLMQQHAFRGKRIAVVDTGNLGLTWQSGHRHLHRLVWATVGLQTYAGRQTVDIALPAMPKTSWFSEHPIGFPFSSRPYLVTLAGSLSTGSQISHKILHAASGEVDIRLGTSGELRAMGPARHLLSKFVLVLSTGLGTGFVEVVCSGAVPVLIAADSSRDSLVPPFESCTNFRMYGISVQNIRVDDLFSILRGVSQERWEDLRVAARSTCMRHFQTMASVSLSLIDSLTLPFDLCTASSVSTTGAKLRSVTIMSPVKEVSPGGERYGNCEGMLCKASANQAFIVVRPMFPIRDFDIYEGELFIVTEEGRIFRSPVPFVSQTLMQAISGRGVRRFQITDGNVFAQLDDGKVWKQKLASMHLGTAWTLAEAEVQQLFL